MLAVTRPVTLNLEVVQAINQGKQGNKVKYFLLLYTVYIYNRYISLVFLLWIARAKFLFWDTRL